MSERVEWGLRLRSIARDWLFGDLGSEAVPRVILLPLENPDLHDHDAFAGRLAHARRYRSITIGEYAGRPIGVMHSKFGGAAVVTAVDVLSDCGVTDVLGVGFCGGVAPDVACGSLVIATAAVRDDGISERHVPLGFPAIADPHHVAALEQQCTARGLRPHAGIVWTVDAPASETSSGVQRWSSLGVVGVDMESAVLFTLARARRLRASSLLVASDNATLGTCAVAEPLRAGVAMAIEVSFAVAASL